MSHLRSPYDTVGGIVYFGRLLDKIRLHLKGELSPEYAANLGAKVPGTFDARCCEFLGFDYAALEELVRTQPELTDDEILKWVFAHGRRPTAEQIEVWNGFMTKRGWRDAGRERLLFRLNEASLPTDGSIATMFDYIDVDEGRPLRQWE